MRRWTVLAALALLLLAVSVSAVPASAQTRSVFWERWDVEIDNVDTTANRFDVAEIYDIAFTGSFSFGSAVIPATNLENIDNIRVFQDGQALRQGCSNQSGTYCVSTRPDEVSITYYFLRPITNGKASFRIEYTVHGALRVYEGGDQLWWIAIPEEHYGFPIAQSTITVTLPQGYAPREGVDPVVTYGAPTTVTVEGNRVIARATRQIGGSESLEIRVQYPHDPNARVPGWQASFDERRAFEENVQPILNLFFLVLSLAIAIDGPLFLYTRWLKKGRDPKVGPVPEYLSEPPSSLPPAVVGSLIDERADVRDVMSTLIDLARRGYLVIEESQTEGFFGIGRSSSFTFKRTDQSLADLRPFEQRVMNQVFSGNRMERSLESLRNQFYTVIPQVQNDLYDELVREELFKEKPSTTRAKWSALGVLLLVVAGLGFFVAVNAIEVLGGLVVLLPVAIGIVAVMTFIVAQAMPAKTRKGAEEAAKWGAFLNYLQNLEKYGNVEEAKAHFDEYLPYAVAFGLDRTWMAKFRRVQDMPVPPWYYPTYVGGPWRRGYVAGSPLHRGRGSFGGQDGLPGDLARAGDGGFSMDTLSESMAMNMENLSKGLASMMESATRAMTSRPQSASSGTSGSWGRGGRSWSGGGFSGGGGSGGGSRGFG